MTWFQRLWRRKQLEEQLDKELQFHLEQRVADLRAAGSSEARARRQAHQELGGMAQTKEDCREARGTQWIESTLQDFRYAQRGLRKAPAFSAAALATLALGIGANTAIFQLLDAVRLRSLPVPDPYRLARLDLGNDHGFGISHYPDNLSYPILEQIRKHQQAFSGVFAWDSGNTRQRIGTGDQARRVPKISVSGEFFPTLGIAPAAGRFFGPQDDLRGCPAPPVVLSYDFWQSEFGGRPSAIGSRLIVQDLPLEIVGVAPPGFTGAEVGARFDIALPLCSRTVLDNGNPAWFERRDAFWLNVMARLKPGWSIPLASAHLAALSSGIMQATEPSGYPQKSFDRYLGFHLRAIPGATGVSRLRQEYDASLWLLLGLTGLVLLIACANLANLLLARAGAREREFALRLALGAGTGRIVRQALTESLVLAFAGAAGGLLLASAISRAILQFLSTGGNPIPLDLSLDWRMLAFTAAAASATCILLGIAPAFRTRRAQPVQTMKTGGRGLTADRGRFGFQRLLVVAQVAISMILVTGAFVFVASFRRLAEMDPGFRASGLLVANFGVTPQGPPLDQLLEQVRSTPRVESAVAVTNSLIASGSWSLGIRTAAATNESKFTWVSPGYFATLRTPMLAGRDFTPYDTATSPKVAVVNQLFANRYFPGVDPIGKTFRTLAEPNYPAGEYQIVGLIRNTRYFSLQDREPPIAYGPISQYPPGFAGALMFIRSAAPLAEVESAVRKRVTAWRPGMAVQFQVFEQQIAESLMRERLLAALSGFFGALAGLLAIIGLYGVLAYQTVRRRNEIGIRVALGATRRQVVGLVVKEAALLVSIGIVLGAAGSLAAGRAAAALVFGVSARDPRLLASAAAALAAAAALGSLFPARRASRLDPMTALRDE